MQTPTNKKATIEEIRERFDNDVERFTWTKSRSDRLALPEK